MLREIFLTSVVASMASACTKDDTSTAITNHEASPDDTNQEAEDDGAKAEGPNKGGLTDITQKVIDEARQAAGDPLRFVPDTADFVAQVHPPALLAYGPIADLWSKLEADDHDSHVAMNTLRSCLGSLEVFDTVVVGFDTQGHIALVAHAEKLGTDETWQCMRSRTIVESETWDLKITGTARGKGPQLLSDDGDLGYFVDDHTLVMISKEWEAEVGALLETGVGTPAIEGRLAPPMGRITRDDPLWVVGVIEASALTGISAGTPFGGAKDLSFGLRIEGDDIALATAFDAGQDSDAITMRDQLEQKFDEFKSILPMMGFPATIGPKIKFEREGDLVSLDLSLTRSELEAIESGVTGMF